MNYAVTHPLNGRIYYLCGREQSCKPKYRLSWCEQVGKFGYRAWFSDRVWIFPSEKQPVILL